jgi:thiaminase/transcriptional activator TenA
MRTDVVWAAIHRHPFVRAIGDGSISRDRLEFYLRQDHAYLVDFARVIALAAARAPDVEGMRFFSSLLETTLHAEMDLHRRTCASHGIGLEELEAVEPGLVTLSYSSFLIRTLHEGSAGDVPAVLLPCAAGYVEIADGLRSAGPPDHPWCREWIETYSGQELRRVANRLAAGLDEIAAVASGPERARFEDLYRTSARYELLFFDAAWRMSDWPDPVPRSRVP